jgi:hypothetical protein
VFDSSDQNLHEKVELKRRSSKRVLEDICEEDENQLKEVKRLRLMNEKLNSQLKALI